MVNDKIRLRADTRIGIITRQRAVCKFIGEVSVYDQNNRLLFHTKNDIKTALLNKSAQGAAVGTFNAVNKMRFKEQGGTVLATESTSKIAGGTGAEDYVTFEATYTNGSGVTKTVGKLDLGYDLGGGGEVIYCDKDITDQEVLNTNSLKVQWKITFALDSGDLTSTYRYRTVQMLNSGIFVVGDKINFIDTTPANHEETASLNDGGTGAEAYHEWTATYNATGSITIDKVYYIKSGDANYTTKDITNKALSNGESIIAYVTITHSS